MIRNFTKLTKQSTFKKINLTNQRTFYNNIKEKQWTKMLVLGGSVATFGGLYIYNKNEVSSMLNCVNTMCATLLKSQTSVVTAPKKHALYLTIHLEPDANVKEVLKVLTAIDKFVDIISPKEMRDEDDEILTGVAFGPNFLSKVRPSKPAPMNFAYYDRKGLHGAMPSTGGDIFIHAKSNEFSKVFELAKYIINHLPPNSIEKFEDLYGWVYRNGRDLSGFIDGTENPADDEHRQHVAVNPLTGGSFAITQKWIHRHNVINTEKESVLESWVGRNRSDSTELNKKSATSHVSRMTGGANFEQKKKFEIVRQSQPFGSLSGESGLFFIGYSSNIEALDFMLDRMVGASHDGLNDDVMRLSKCTESTYWYFPGQEELKEITPK